MKNARLEPVKVNNVFPRAFEMTVEVGGEKIRTISGFPLGWTVGTPKEGIKGDLAYVGDGSDSNYKLVDVKGKIALIDHRHYRHLSTASGGAVIAAKEKGG